MRSDALVKAAGWIVTAAAMAWACALALQHGTPIDDALPFLAVAVTLLAAFSYRELLAAVPLLVVLQFLLPDETARLLVMGLVLSVCFAVALQHRGEREVQGTGVGWKPTPHGALSTSATSDSKPTPHQVLSTSGTSDSKPTPHQALSTSATSDSKPITPHQSLLSRLLPRVVWASSPPPSPAQAQTQAPLITTILAILILRWIPFSEVLLFRELILLVLSAAIVMALRNTPFGAAVAILTALVTPAIPMRTLLLPLFVLIVAAITRPRWQLRVASAAAIALPMLFFAWSGIVARALPYFLNDTRPAVRRHFVNAALAPNRSVTVDVPHDAQALIVSGANVPRFRRGFVLGRIEPGGLVVRIGDASDWGYLRRESFYAARNPLPRDPAGKIRGYGYTAWIDGAGRVELPKGARTIRITADPALPAEASLQVEAFELP